MTTIAITHTARDVRGDRLDLSLRTVMVVTNDGQCTLKDAVTRKRKGYAPGSRRTLARCAMPPLGLPLPFCATSQLGRWKDGEQCRFGSLARYSAESEGRDRSRLCCQRRYPSSMERHVRPKCALCRENEHLLVGFFACRPYQIRCKPL